MHDEIPEQDHEVGMSLIDDGDAAIELRGIDVGRARVEIRYDGDGERRHGPRPRGEGKIDLLDHEPAGLDGHAQRARPRQITKSPTAPMTSERGRRAVTMSRLA
jgi:hypothetical protein